jgi:predicted phosphodiesterase
VKYGLISDLHANVEALEAVLARLAAEGVDRIACLGDVVGYHANPNECVQLVRDRCTYVIAGNHDRATLGTIGMSEFGFVARRAVHWTAERLAADHAAFLRALDITGPIDATAMMVHGALVPEPNDRFHITTPERITANLERLAAAGGPRVCFFGHTHRGVAHALRDSGVETLRNPASVELEPGVAYLINPGSVGQPRDGDWRAACAIYDSGRRRVDFMRVEYDVSACRAKAAAAGLLEPPTIARRSFEVARAGLYDAAELAGRVWKRARR